MIFFTGIRGDLSVIFSINICLVFKLKWDIMKVETEYLSEINKGYEHFYFRYLVYRLIKLLIIAGAIFIMFYTH